jgi:hypothetical protein
MSGGQKANESGLSWEAWVRVTAQQCKFDILPISQQANYKIPKEQRRIIWTHVPYPTIYNEIKAPKEWRTSTEFVIENRGSLCRVECKWQSVSGSVDEKFPFMLLNGVLTMPEPTIIFGIGGTYFETPRGKEVLQWLSNACKTPPHWLSADAVKLWHQKEFLVLTPNTFGNWFRERFGTKP